ncbi:RNA polymerase factor sigma-32 [Bacteriovorax sp. PP10]|uniref:RNA polymerase factor sigma-32 n=1 Tax=Bacteriovorax antarcticus TaxID=3088717 RepID=A0ABU5VYL7_9BACT|nr:RNA polymerase factor sigma-32 [Bacteriovorax sp. PP10]MEA9358096.1 RNA polymerase factor sigma-32 [Bacteriovorax sp. PP10]
MAKKTPKSTDNQKDALAVMTASTPMSNQLQIVQNILSHNQSDTLPSATDPLTQYVREISRYKLLTLEEEETLLKELQETGDIDVAKKLVLANLRLVVKIAIEYRSAWQNVMDLIQEGNIGLMKAVSKYDGTKGAKLSYYASWWIRSYILKFILDNFRLVKIGTTNEQKKLFFNLMKEKERLIGLGFSPDNKMISESLGVSEKSVAVMDKRLSQGGGELSLEAKLDENGPSLADILTDKEELSMDEKLGDLQGVEILKEQLQNFLGGLKDRDREIFEMRLLSEVPASLQTIADQYGVSRERIRQIEERLIGNLKVYMSEFIR